MIRLTITHAYDVYIYIYKDMGFEKRPGFGLSGLQASGFEVLRHKSVEALNEVVPSLCWLST